MLLCCWAVTEFTDTGLSPFSWYEYRVSIDNGFGNATSSAVVYRTSADKPSGNFTVTVELIEARTVSLSWTAPSSPNGVIQRYLVESLDQCSEQQSNVTHYDGLALGFSLSSLTPYCLYVLTVRACTTAGCISESVTAITLQAAPDGQQPPNITAIGPTALNVSWQPPSQPNGNCRFSYVHQ